MSVLIVVIGFLQVSRACAAAAGKRRQLVLPSTLDSVQLFVEDAEEAPAAPVETFFFGSVFCMKRNRELVSYEPITYYRVYISRCKKNTPRGTNYRVDFIHLRRIHTARIVDLVEIFQDLASTCFKISGRHVSRSRRDLSIGALHPSHRSPRDISRSRRDLSIGALHPSKHPEECVSCVFYCMQVVVLISVL